jgi:glycosyltransferase involved in cell wall biosynthesis
VSVEQKADLLAGAAVLAYPSVYEGFGLVPLEAMAAGVPVVATAAGAVPEVVGQGADLCPVGDPDALAAALARVLDDPERTAALVVRGRERAERFTWHGTVDAMVRLYHLLASSSS